MKNRFLLLGLSAALLAGCTKENTTGAEGGNTLQGEFVSVTLPMQVAETDATAPSAMSKSPVEGNSAEGFSVSFSEAAASREANTATRIAEATAATPSTRTIALELTNVWILQFDSTGKNVSTTNTGTLAGGAYLTASSLQVGTGYTICIVANGTASGLTTTNPATLTAFESTMLHTDAVTDAAKLPLGGKLTGVTVVNMGDGKGKISLSSSAPATILMKRIQAEVTLTVDFGVTGYTLTGAELYNVPIGATYGWDSATTTFPVNTVAANFGYTDLAAAGMTPVTTSTSGGKTTYKWFVGDNRRGDVAGLTAQSDRNKTKAPAYATFARITIKGARTIMYDVYLGSGAVTNFDVKRNMTYTQTAAIKGSAAFHEALVDTDARVSGKGFAIWLTDNKSDSPFGISPKDMESTSRVWGPGPTTTTGITDIYNGKGNTDKMMALSATAYPAAKYCRDLGAEWNLPAQAQLMLVWIYFDAIPSADRLAADKFWSATEFSETRYAWYVGFAASSYTYHDDKRNAHCVRCVRDGVNPGFGSWSYPKVENGNTIVSRDAAGGIKSDALLTAAQKTFLMNQTTQPIYHELSEYNKVSAKFQVASTDAVAGASWNDAYSLCKSYSTGAAAGSWRMPTQRELMLIWVLKTKLTACGNLSIAYWSGTEDSTSNGAWLVLFSDGEMLTMGKPSMYYPRCVRDL